MTDFTGVWNVRIHAPIGVQQVRLVISGAGDRLEGTATQGSETVPLLDIERDGDTLRWRQKVTKPMKLEIKFDVRLAAGKLEGKAKAGIFPSVRLDGERAAS